VLVDALNPAAVAAGIGRMLDDEGLASACVAKGVQRALRFTWSETAARVYEVYQQAMDRRPRTTA